MLTLSVAKFLSKARLAASTTMQTSSDFASEEAPPSLIRVVDVIRKKTRSFCLSGSSLKPRLNRAQKKVTRADLSHREVLLQFYRVMGLEERQPLFQCPGLKSAKENILCIPRSACLAVEGSLPALSQEVSCRFS